MDPAPAEAHEMSFSPYFDCYATVGVLSSHPLPSVATMGKGNVTADELLARAQANGYKRGEHREKDQARDGYKHVEKTKKDQNAALNRYVL